MVRARTSRLRRDRRCSRVTTSATVTRGGGSSGAGIFTVVETEHGKVQGIANAGIHLQVNGQDRQRSTVAKLMANFNGMKVVVKEGVSPEIL